MTYILNETEVTNPETGETYTSTVIDLKVFLEYKCFVQKRLHISKDIKYRKKYYEIVEQSLKVLAEEESSRTG